MLPGGCVLNGLHPRLLSIRTYGAPSGCFGLVGHGGIAALESSVGAKEHSRGCNPRYWCTPTQQNRGAVASNIPLRCFHLLWNFVIRRNNYRILSLGVAYVLCAPLATALRFQMGMVCAHRGFHLFRGFHPRL